MSRYAAVSESAILDAAERILRSKGPAAISIDAVATEAGVSKGGIQSRFGTRQVLIESILRRCLNQFDELVRDVSGPNPSVGKGMRAHILTTQKTSHDDAQRAAGLAAALLQTPEQLAWVRSWYAKKLAGGDTSTPSGKAARIAFFATEGIFLLRYLGLMTLSDSEWSDVFVDVLKLLGEEQSE